MTKPNRLPNGSDPICEAANCPKSDRHFVPRSTARIQRFHDNECKGLAMVTKVTITCDRGCGRVEEKRPDVLHDGKWTCQRCANQARAIPADERFAFYAQGVGTEPAHVPGIGPCTLWTGPMTKDGYGALSLADGAHGAQIQAHIYAWMQASGPVVKGLYVCHRCDNRACVKNKPRGTFMLDGRATSFSGHLFLGTKPDNTVDMVEKDRQAKGERMAFAKLTDAIVWDCRVRYAAGGISQQALADEFNVAQPVMGAALRGKTWKHVRQP